MTSEELLAEAGATRPVGRNGYIALKPSPETAKRIAQIVADAGIENAIAPEDLHVTLFYAPEGLPDTVHDTLINPEQVHVGFALPEPRLLGEDPWKALVIELTAPTLSRRHALIKEVTGGEHSFPDYLPHLSLKYGPEEGDIDKIRGLHALASLAIDLTGEYCEDIDD